MIKLKYLILPIVVVVFGVTTCYGYFEDFFDGAEYAAGYTDPYDHNEFVHIHGKYRWEKCYPGISSIGEISDPVIARSIVFPGNPYEVVWEMGEDLDHAGDSESTFKNFSGAGRNVTLDVNDGKYQVMVAFHAQYTNPPYIDGVGLEIGDHGILTGVEVGNRYVLQIDGRDSVETIYLGKLSDGVHDTNIISFFELTGHLTDYYSWYEIKVEIDMTAGTASAYWRDIDDFSKAPSGSWVFVGDFPGPIPFASLNAVAIYGADNGSVDNFRSGYVGYTAEVTDCNMAVEAGLNPEYDLNGDCYVGGFDLLKVANDWLRCVDPCDVNCEVVEPPIKPWLE